MDERGVLGKGVKSSHGTLLCRSAEVQTLLWVSGVANLSKCPEESASA